MKIISQKELYLKNEESELFQRDIWKVEEIGFKPDTAHGIYQLNFSRLRPDWFKSSVKLFVNYQAATKSLSSCFSYVGRLSHFSDFLDATDLTILPHQIDRELILKYISFLTKSNLSITTRSMALIHLRTFHGIMLQEKWLPWLKEPLIYNSDIPKKIETIPRFIPEYIISQLQIKLQHLPIYMQHFITVLLETGRRVGEICTLPLNCLEMDDQGDYFLRVNDRKLKKSYLIPISDACIKAIKTQQILILDGMFQNKFYLFATRKKFKTPHVSARFVNHSLTKLANKHKILDENGNIWHFSSHQFRHTVGTRMINAGVPQTIIQKYLGHESPEMTARYAHIHDETLKIAFNKYHGNLIDIHGKLHHRANKDEYAEAKWLQHNTMAQALPNGICGLPSLQQRCPHANACLTCTHFRTNKQFLSQHQNQLEMTNKLIETAQENGWQRQVEINMTVKNNLKKIITKLQEDN